MLGAVNLFSRGAGYRHVVGVGHIDLDSHVAAGPVGEFVRTLAFDHLEWLAEVSLREIQGIVTFLRTVGVGIPAGECGVEAESVILTLRALISQPALWQKLRKSSAVGLISPL